MIGCLPRNISEDLGAPVAYCQGGKSGMKEHDSMLKNLASQDISSCVVPSTALRRSAHSRGKTAPPTPEETCEFSAVEQPTAIAGDSDPAAVAATPRRRWRSLSVRASSPEKHDEEKRESRTGTARNDISPTPAKRPRPTAPERDHVVRSRDDKAVVDDRKVIMSYTSRTDSIGPEHGDAVDTLSRLKRSRIHPQPAARSNRYATTREEPRYLGG